MTRIDFKLPDIGEGVAEGEITSWKVAPGDRVTEDQPIVEVMTDKATVEIGSPVDGRIVELLVDEGETVPVGNVIVVLESGTEAEAADDATVRERGGGAREQAPPKKEQEKEGKKKEEKAPRREEAEPARAGGGDLEEIDFPLPDIGEGVAEGEVTKWLVSEGDTVTEDQPLVEVMTDKATVEIGSPVDGEVVRILVDEGATVPVGEILVVLGAEGAPGKPSDGGGARADRAPAASSEPRDGGGNGRAGERAGVAPAAEQATATLPDTGLPPRADGSRRVRAAPATRRLARELGVDIAALTGSGPRGRVTNADVRAAEGTAPARRPAAPAAPGRAAPSAPATAARAAPAAPVSAPRPHDLPGDERVPLRGLRKAIARQMRVAKQTAAHFTYVEEIDVTELVALRRRAKPMAEKAGVKLTYMPFIMKAMLAALREYPLMNASLDEERGEVVYHQQHNFGIAIDTEAGLTVPVIRDVDGKSPYALAAELSDLAERARAGKLRPEDFEGGTFTITNAGNIGGLLATPVINVPEVAILGVHAIRRRPWVVDDEIVVRDIMCLSFSLDHRVVDGAVGAYAMNVVKERLENPALMMLDA